MSEKYSDYKGAIEFPKFTTKMVFAELKGSMSFELLSDFDENILRVS